MKNGSKLDVLGMLGMLDMLDALDMLEMLEMLEMLDSKTVDLMTGSSPSCLLKGGCVPGIITIPAMGVIATVEDPILIASQCLDTKCLEIRRRMIARQIIHGCLTRLGPHAYSAQYHQCLPTRSTLQDQVWHATWLAMEAATMTVLQ